MIGVLTDFAATLRGAGVPVSPTEVIDAAEALATVDLARRAEVRAALGATLVKSAAHSTAFDTAFELFFSDAGQARDGSPEPGAADDDTVSGAPDAGVRSEGARGSGGDTRELPTPAELAALVADALEGGDPADIAATARLAVVLHAGIEAGRRVGGSYYLQRTLRAIDLDGALARLIAAALASGDASPSGPSGAKGGDALARLRAMGPLGDRLVVEELRRRAAALTRAIEAEIRRRLVAELGAAAVARSVLRPLVEDLDFMRASREELARMRQTLVPLTRILASRLARRRRRHRRGPLDFRTTIRHSLSSGGVPLELAYRPPHPSKPEIVVIADISGSVASFARFTLHLVHALASQFSKVRTFVFVDGLDEVSAILSRERALIPAVEAVMAEADVISSDGHSDYGSALSLFVERYARAVTHRSVVLVLGDARNNYHAPRAELLAQIRRRARHLYWLNPEPRAYWDSGDSVIGAYAPYCEEVVECRNLRQLEAFVDKLA